MIGLDSYSRQDFNYLDSFSFISVFDSTAYLKFAKLQCFLWLSLPGGYRVTDEALLAETT